MEARDDKPWHIRQLFAVELHLLAFALVIGFFVELLLGSGHQLFDLQLGRGKARHFEQGHHIIHIAVDAFGNAGILHLDRQLFAIAGQGLVHLANAGGCDRARIEPAELLAPIGPPFGFEHLIELLGRHEIGLIAQGRKDPGKLVRQEIAGIKADHLPHLHRRAAQVREAIGQTLDIAGGEDQIARRNPFAAGEPPRAFGHHAARDPAHQPPEGADARHPAGRHRPLAAAILRELVEIGNAVVVGHGAGFPVWGG